MFRHLRGCVGHCAGVGALALMALAGPVGAQPPQPPQPQGSASPDLSAQIAALAAQLVAVLAAVGANGSVQDVEGRLIYAITQSQLPCSAVQAALAQAGAGAGRYAPAARRSLQLAQGAAGHCSRQGIAALATPQDVIQQGTTLGLPGGSSNYLSTR